MRFSYSLWNKILAFCLVFSFCFIPVSLATESTYVWSNASNALDALPTTASTSENTNSLKLEAGSAILIEQT